MGGKFGGYLRFPMRRVPTAKRHAPYSPELGRYSDDLATVDSRAERDVCILTDAATARFASNCARGIVDSSGEVVN